MTVTADRPGRTLCGQTTEVTIGGTKIHLTVTEHPVGRPVEVFVRAGKQGSTLAGMCEALSQVVTVALRNGVPVEEIAEPLRGLHFEPAGRTSDQEVPDVTSLTDYVARRLVADYRFETEDL
jgi:hypothetical protein